MSAIGHAPGIEVPRASDSGLKMVLWVIRMGPPLILVLLCLILTLLTPFFLTGDNLTNLLVPVAPLAAIADRESPRLVTHDARGERINRVDYHPAYREMQRIAYGSGMIAMKYETHEHSNASQLVGFALGQACWPGPEVGPALLDLGQGRGVAAFRLDRVAGVEAALFLALADVGAQVLRNAFPEPVDAGFGVLPGAGHGQGHLYHPFVPLG